MPEHIEHSQNVSALLGKPPSWLVRWGTTIIFGVVFSLLVLAAFVRYPDVIQGSATISSVNPPQVLQAKRTGRIAELLASEGAHIKQGDVLAVLEDAASLANVRIIDSLVTFLALPEVLADSGLPRVNWPNVAIGGMQSNYILLQQLYTDYFNFLEQAAYKKEIAAMKKQLNMYYQFYERSWDQRQVLQAQFDLTKARYKTDSLLTLEGVYAEQDLMQRKEALLQRKFSLHGARAALAQTQIQIAELEKNINQLLLTYQRERTSKRQALAQAIKSMQNDLKIWFTENAFVADIEGTLNYQLVWAVNQNVLGNQHVFTIVPQQKSAVKALVVVSPPRASKINTGQRVQIKLDAYPYEEYGMLVGKVEKMNSTPTTLSNGNMAYVVEVDFPDELVTSYHKQLTELAEISGTAEIITEELSLLERLFYQLLKLVT